MKKVNDFDVQRFDSCLRAALYEKFISNIMGNDNAETIAFTSDRAFIKQNAIKSRNYKNRPNLFEFSVPLYRRNISSKENLKNRIVTQKTNGKIKRLRKKTISTKPAI